MNIIYLVRSITLYFCVNYTLRYTLKDNIYTRDEFLSKIKAAEAELAQWEEKKLVKCIGFTDDKTPFYAENAVKQVEQIRKLQELGYPLDDIQKIIKKVGLPQQMPDKNKPEVKPYLTVGNLAERVNISPRTVKHWESLGIIEPDMRSEGGFRLYSEMWVPLCFLIKDLQLFGYSLEQIKVLADSYREFLVMQSNLDSYSKQQTQQKLEKKQEELEELIVKIDELKSGIQRWEELLRKKKKELVSLKNQNQKRNTQGETYESGDDAL